MNKSLRTLSLGAVLVSMAACAGGNAGGNDALHIEEIFVEDSIGVCVSPDDTYFDPAEIEVALINAMTIWNTLRQYDDSTDIVPSDHYDAQNILTHELGHVLGIRHVENPEAILFRYSVSKGNKERGLHAADVEAYLALENPAVFVYEGIATDCDIVASIELLEDPADIGYRWEDRIALNPKYPLYFTQEDIL